MPLPRLKRVKSKGRYLYYIIQTDGKKTIPLEKLGNVTKSEAQEYLRKKYHSRVKQTAKSHTFSDVSKEFETIYSKDRKKFTLISFQRNVGKAIEVFGDTSIKEISYKDIERFKNIISDTGLSNRSINIALIEVTKVFNYAIRAGYIDSKPLIDKMAEIRTKEVERLYHEHIQLIRTHSSPKLRYYCDVMLGTGMRPAEFRNLTWSDINFEKGFINVISDRKNKIGRKIPISFWVKNALREASATYKHPYPYDSAFGAPLGLKRLSKALGFKIVPYMFRKTFASMMVELGVSRTILQQWMGHRVNSNVLDQAYLNLELESMRSAIEKTNFEQFLTTPKIHKISIA